MKYSAAYYDQILNAVVKEFSIDVPKVPGRQWLVWKTQIKKLFDNGILITEILQAIPEAGEKRKWPMDTAFWHRVEDVVLKNRREQKPLLQREIGASSLKELLAKRLN